MTYSVLWSVVKSEFNHFTNHGNKGALTPPRHGGAVQT